MVRSERYLQIIEEDRLVEHAAGVGAHLLARLEALQGDRPDVVSNARGRGLMCAIDFTTPAIRNAVAADAFNQGVIILSCGERSLRFRPPLDITAGEIDEAVDVIAKAIAVSALPAA
jgi:L-lysine 6-transaminase